VQLATTIIITTITKSFHILHNSTYLQPLLKVFSDEAHMSGSEIDDGTDKATAWKRRLDIVILKLSH
jgi:hypothetical protein